MDVFLVITEWIGTVAFAMSGALLAIRKKLDIFGVMLLAIITALGGGTVRDLLIGHLPPKMFYSSSYLLVSTFVALLIFVIVRALKGVPAVGNWWEILFTFCDAMGLGIFAVVGTQNAIMMGFRQNVFLCVFMGMTTGVGGGVIRDIMCAEIPAVLRKHIYAVAAIIGSLQYYYMVVLFHMNETFVSCISIVLIVTIRMLANYYKWNLPKATK